jgi:DNA-directed RNA polymerase, mitochondrial
MMRTVNWASEAGVTHLQMVHDSFGTHAMDAPALATALREAAVSLFRTDQLAWLRDQIQQQLPHGAALEPLPEYGSLSIDALKDAEYFFH